jgi:aryl sulfotransferase
MLCTWLKLTPVARAGSAPSSRSGQSPPFCYSHGVASALIRYQSHDEDSARWLSFVFRPGDIVISTRRRTGTTWMQVICGLLIFQRPELPAPLWHLSPWLDHLVVPADLVYSRLAEQPHRRFIKTHTPLDGIPQNRQVTYIVTVRHPLDAFVSFRRQIENMDRTRMEQLTGEAIEPETSETLHDSLVRWIEEDADPRADRDSLPGMMSHFTDAWAKRYEPNVVLVHYDDLRADLEGQMRALAWRLGIDVPEGAWRALTSAASFQRMRDHSERLIPATQGIIKDTASFFSRGTSGAGGEILSADEMARYHARAAQLAPPDMLEWLHWPSSLRTA